MAGQIKRGNYCHGLSRYVPANPELSEAGYKPHIAFHANHDNKQQEQHEILCPFLEVAEFNSDRNYEKGLQK